MSSYQVPEQSITSDKGICGFMWGPGCSTQDAQRVKIGSYHLCLLPKGHDGDCHCFDDETYSALGQIARKRV